MDEDEGMDEMIDDRLDVLLTELAEEGRYSEMEDYLIEHFSRV